MAMYLRQDGPVMPGPMPNWGGGGSLVTPGPIRPAPPEGPPNFLGPPATSPGGAPNVLSAQAVRPSGPSKGFDPQYLQNLATAIGGLFSRPKGNLKFNPLGDLSEISPDTGFGNAPLPGLPSTMLQDALEGLAFMFGQPASPTTGGNMPLGSGFRGRGDGNGRLRL
jgi:hypothetical protein